MRTQCRSILLSETRYQTTSLYPPSPLYMYCSSSCAAHCSMHHSVRHTICPRKCCRQHWRMMTGASPVTCGVCPSRRKALRERREGVQAHPERQGLTAKNLPL